MDASDRYRIWWGAGAILIVLLVVDFFVALGWAAPWLETPLAWFILGFLTLASLAATIILRPRRAATR